SVSGAATVDMGTSDVSELSQITSPANRVQDPNQTDSHSTYLYYWTCLITIPSRIISWASRSVKLWDGKSQTPPSTGHTPWTQLRVLSCIGGPRTTIEAHIRMAGKVAEICRLGRSTFSQRCLWLCVERTASSDEKEPVAYSNCIINRKYIVGIHLHATSC